MLTCRVPFASEWWEPESRAGVGLLHHMNPTRVGYIRSTMRACGLAGGASGGSSMHARARAPLTGLRMLDVGCGGGILSESLARLGASVTAIDPAAANIGVARAHAALDPLTSGIDYRCCAVEQLAEQRQDSATGDGTREGSCEDGLFDAICALEVIEHVNEPSRALFLSSMCSMLRPGGVLFLSTLNRTQKAFALAVFGAERVARLLPAGTHDWNKFCTPDELRQALATHALQVQDVSGIVFRPSVHGLKFSIDPNDIDVNFILHARKEVDAV